MDEQRMNSLSMAQVRQIFGVDDGPNDEFFVAELHPDIPNNYRNPFRINAGMIAFCTEGAATVGIGLDEYRMEKGSVLICLPNNMMQFVCEQPTSIRVIVFSDAFLKDIHVDLSNLLPLVMQIHRCPFFSLSPEDWQMINVYYNLIAATVSTKNFVHKKEVIRGLISSLIYRMGDLAAEAVADLPDSEFPRFKSRRELYFENFMTLLYDHFRTERQVGFYADRLCITPKYLSLVVKQVSGRTAAEWIDSHVIMEAKTLLKYSDLSIQQIAYELNFSTQSFFGKYFKHLTGLSPREYRRSATKG